jgi:glycosyltransferase involved in cell wall biosynthesis
VTRRVAFVGPLPPPLHGFSGVCAMMLARLRKCGAVEVFDRAPRAASRATEVLRQLREAIRYCAMLRGGTDIAFYLALSGGLGQIIDALYVLAARVAGKPAFVHHHSFSYLNRATAVNKLLFSQLRNATHIVLSEGMGAALADRYKIDGKAIRVVSNAAFFGPPVQTERRLSDPSAPVCIGFLSNITFDKGFVQFFEVLTTLRRAAVPYRAYIAGPVASDARSTFDRLFAAAAEAEYVGPLYGDAKTSFYQRLDILLFPTRYENEAEPLVIHEAIRSGVHVIACARGAIPELLSNGAGVVFDQNSFVSSAATCIEGLSLDRPGLAQAQQMSFAQAQRLQLRAEAQLSDVVRQILHQV